MGAGAPFGLIAQALRRAAAIATVTPDAARPRWARWVARHVVSPDANRVAEFLGELAGVGEKTPSAQLGAARTDARLMGDQIARAWEELVSAECGAGPVLVAFDDVHWGDLPSLGLVEGALRRLSEAPLMVLVLGRPELAEIFPRLFVDRGAQTLQLGALTKGSSEKLLRAALGDGVDPSAVARAVETSGGNAFYLEELARAVAEGPLERVPESVLAMGEARLRSLDPDMRRVLRAASVFGEVFWTSAVARLTGRDSAKESLDAMLVSLTKNEIVTARSPSRFGNTAEYAFRHALLRDASYATLTPEDRETGHRLAASWLENAGERSALVLANHFELGGLPDRAASHFARAARDALGGNDFAAVEVMVAKAIRGGLRGNELAEAHLLLAEAHLWRGENPKAIESTLAAMQAADRPSATWFVAVSEAVAVAARTLDQSLQAELIAILCNEPITDDLEAAYVFACARALMGATGIEASAQLLDRVEATARGAKLDARTMGRLRVVRGVHSPNPETRIREVEAARMCFEEAGDHRYATLAQMNLGHHYAEVGAWEQAESAVRRASAQAVELGLAQVATWAKSILADVFRARGKLEEAETVARAALLELSTQQSRRYESTTRALLARVRVARGDLDDAEAQARAALECGAGVAAEANAAACLSEVLLARGRNADALTWARHAIHALEHHGVAEEWYGAAVRLALIRALHASGMKDEARQELASTHADLLARAAQIESPELRASLLERIFEHAAIVALVRDWG
jgi:tetratricopeptide (TPR) repeat protein